MNEWILWLALFQNDLEQIMRRAIGAGLLVFGIVLFAGVLFGWPYALLIGFIIVLLLNLVGRRA